MQEIMSKIYYLKIISDIKMKHFYVKGEIEGLIAGVEEMFDELYTKDKVIKKSDEKNGLHVLQFISDRQEDLEKFYDYMGYFNEGNMELCIYEHEKTDTTMHTLLFDHPLIKITVIDGDEILVEKY